MVALRGLECIRFTAAKLDRSKQDPNEFILILIHTARVVTVAPESENERCEIIGWRKLPKSVKQHRTNRKHAKRNEKTMKQLEHT